MFIGGISIKAQINKLGIEFIHEGPFNKLADKEISGGFFGIRTSIIGDLFNFD